MAAPPEDSPPPPPSPPPLPPPPPPYTPLAKFRNSLFEVPFFDQARRNALAPKEGSQNLKQTFPFVSFALGFTIPT